MRWFLLLVFLVGCTGYVVEEVTSMRVYSPAFERSGMIPAKYTCDGENVNPPIIIEDIPGNAKSLVLIVADPDAPSGWFTHWVLFNIPITNEIKENSVPAGALQGLNDFKRIGYGGPCPPSGTHRYRFKVYAVDKMLDLPAGSSEDAVERAIDGHVLAWEETVGRYAR